MFGNTTERRVVRDADRIVSLKEDMDALSWSRVLELGKHLQEEMVPHEDCADCARELVTIAQSNLSLYARLGIDPAPAPSHVMASGVEVIEGGMAEAALEKHENHSVEKPAPRENTVASDERVTDEQTAPLEQVMAAEDAPTLEKISSLDEPDEHDFEEAANAVRDTAPLFKPAEIAAKLDPAPEVAAAVVTEPEVAPVAAAVTEPEVAPVAAAVPAPETAPAPTPDPAPTPAPEKAQPNVKRGRFSRFKNLYESRDGGLCLFEDERGHLVAVDASKLA